MSDISRNENLSKRRRTAEDESLFTDVTIPLSLPTFPRTIQPCELASEELGVQQEADFSTEYIPQSSAPLTGSETNGKHRDGSRFHSEDFGHEPSHSSQPHGPIEFIDNEELEMDSMWNEVCEALIAESNEHELRDWGSTEEEDSDQFEDIVENMTLPNTIDTLPHEAERLDLREEPPAANIKSSCEQEKLYPGSRVTIGAVMVLITLYAIKYDLTGEAITHLLQFISLLLPTGNTLLCSIHFEILKRTSTNWRAQ